MASGCSPPALEITSEQGEPPAEHADSHTPQLQVIARWLGEQKIAAFGVETMSPGVIDISNREVHHICGALGFTHYENLTNLHQLVGRGRFRFIGFPLKIRGGTGSPVRAVAVFDNLS